MFSQTIISVKVEGQKQDIRSVKYSMNLWIYGNSKKCTTYLTYMATNLAKSVLRN